MENGKSSALHLENTRVRRVGQDVVEAQLIYNQHQNSGKFLGVVNMQLIVYLIKRVNIKSRPL